MGDGTMLGEPVVVSSRSPHLARTVRRVRSLVPYRFVFVPGAHYDAEDVALSPPEAPHQLAASTRHGLARMKIRGGLGDTLLIQYRIATNLYLERLAWICPPSPWSFYCLRKSPQCTLSWIGITPGPVLSTAKSNGRETRRYDYVCFRLAATIKDGDYNDFLIYLQITPDCLDSLHFEPCKKTNGRLPHLDDVRRQLGNEGDLTRLQFRLRRGIHAQLIVSNDSPDYEALADPARHTFDLVASVAASSFSLYLPANKLRNELLDACVEAVMRSSVLTQEEFRSYQRAVNLKRLYRGKGVKVLAASDYNRSSQADGQRNRSTSPATNDSCATTVDFDTVPRDQGSPPQYGECVSEGKKPRTISDDAANLVENSRVDYAPPKYSETDELRTPTFVSKRLRPHGSEDVLSPNPKRLLSRGSFTAISATAVTRNARRLEAKSRPELDDADIDDRVLLRNLMRRVAQQEEQIKHLRQGQQSKQLQQEKIIKQLQDDVEKLRQHTEGGYRELEGICDNLACRQDRAEEDLENLDVHTSELDEICDKLEEQIPNVSDQMGDVLEEYMGYWVKEHLSDWVKEHMEKLVSKHMGKGGEGDLAGLLREFPSASDKGNDSANKRSIDEYRTRDDKKQGSSTPVRKPLLVFLPGTNKMPRTIEKMPEESGIGTLGLVTNSATAARPEEESGAEIGRQCRRHVGGTGDTLGMLNTVSSAHGGAPNNELGSRADYQTKIEKTVEFRE
ncbi:hypothetical protein LX36DRAFT_674399 [Colletotrichum falcatum]|nr:hypothetical protein LX36DRAFT_674399 [Colletotrichum falcatum]